MKKDISPEILPLRKKVLFLAAGLFFLVLRSPGAAEITLDKAEMATRGRVYDNEFVLSSFISADLALTGGYKYAFLLGFSLEAEDVAKAFAHRNFAVATVKPDATAVSGAEYNALAERLNNQAFLGFRTAKATARDLFGLPLELSYFIGSGDNFCTGDEFGPRFGVSPFGTEFKGVSYFPDSIRYDGVHGVRGTGLSFGLTKWENVIPALYVYNDFAFSDSLSGMTEDNFYSGDLRVLINYERLRLEVFSGLSFHPDLDTNIRGGLMVHLAGDGVEFFAQGGIPGWVIEEKLSIDNLFFLLEPRLYFNFFSLFVTFFYHPSEYIHDLTDEQGWADLNLKFQFGKRDSGVAGGLEFGGEFRNESLDDFTLRVAPYGRVRSGGLLWDLKCQIKPLYFDTPEEMFEIFMGVRTAF